ncbi:MAG TPA: protein translocase subunit SecF [Gemmatimonas sp.]|nr:protein translocase subunit SecF [Gemmatimonas sp.]
MLRIFHNTHFEFVKHWRLAAGLTIAFIAAGLLVFAFKRGELNRSIEFTGGTLMQLRFTEAPDVSVLRSTITDAGIEGPEVQQFGSPTEYTVRAQGSKQIEAQNAGAEGVARQIEAALDAKFGAEKVEVVRSEAVGPRVGSELARGAMIAMVIASLFTLVYLAVRFDWRFGAAAVLATAHDILVTFAFIMLLDIEISLTVVAAILTLLGYSANDTIIIFDRVRENLRKQRKGESLRAVLDRAINETLPRSVLTHATTLAATLALLFFAGEVIRPFAMVMAFGIFVATFSSIYVAGPVLLWIESRYPRATSEAAGRAVRAGTTAEGAVANRPRSTGRVAAN